MITSHTTHRHNQNQPPPPLQPPIHKDPHPKLTTATTTPPIHKTHIQNQPTPPPHPPNPRKKREREENEPNHQTQNLVARWYGWELELEEERKKKLKWRRTEHTHHEDWVVGRKKQNWKGEGLIVKKEKIEMVRNLREKEREREMSWKKKKRIKKRNNKKKE